MIYITHRAQIPPVFSLTYKGSQITRHPLVGGHRQPEPMPNLESATGDCRLQANVYLADCEMKTELSMSVRSVVTRDCWG